MVVLEDIIGKIYPINIILKNFNILDVFQETFGIHPFSFFRLRLINATYKTLIFNLI